MNVSPMIPRDLESTRSKNARGIPAAVHSHTIRKKIQTFLPLNKHSGTETVPSRCLSIAARFVPPMTAATLNNRFGTQIDSSCVPASRARARARQRAADSFDGRGEKIDANFHKSNRASE